MNDKEWLQNLANATFKDGTWSHQDPGAARRLAAERFARALTDLEAEAEEAALVFNELAAGRRSIRVLSIPARQGGGFMLLMGRCQVNVQGSGAALVVTLVTSEAFQRKSSQLYRFTPQADPFGSLAWSPDNALILGSELIIKKLFEDLTRAATGAAS